MPVTAGLKGFMPLRVAPLSGLYSKESRLLGVGFFDYKSYPLQRKEQYPDAIHRSSLVVRPQMSSGSPLPGKQIVQSVHGDGKTFPEAHCNHFFKVFQAFVLYTDIHRGGSIVWNKVYVPIRTG